jgi:hypothetical protein
MHTDRALLGFSLISGIVSSIGAEQWMAHLQRARAGVDSPIAVALPGVAAPNAVTAMGKGNHETQKASQKAL